MRRHSPTNIWPGFVDAISTILIIILFLLMVFTLAQHFLTKTLSGRDQALSRLTQQVAELSELLAIEKKESAELRSRIDQLGIDLENTASERDALKNQLVVSREEKQKIAKRVQERLWAIGASGELGQFFTPVAYRNNVKGLIKSPVQFFWNMSVE